MNKTQVAAIGVLVLAGVTAVVMLNQNSGTGTAASEPASNNRKSSAAGSGSGQADNPAQPGDRSRTRPAPANADLVTRYGEARTNLSKHVSSNIVGIMEDAVKMGEMMTSGMGGNFGGGLGMALGRLNGELQLTPEQREKASALVKAHQQRQTERSRAALERLKQDPTSLMKLMLASDASARGDMQDDEYKSVQAEAGKGLMGVINPLDRKNMGGGSPLRDPEFASSFKAILDPTQSAKLDETMAQRQAEATTDPNAVPGVEEGNIASLPKMDLEKLDTSIESARKITTGIKTMMDGMGGLRDLMPPPPPPAGQEPNPASPPSSTSPRS